MKQLRQLFVRSFSVEMCTREHNDRCCVTEDVFGVTMMFAVACTHERQTLLNLKSLN